MSDWAFLCHLFLKLVRMGAAESLREAIGAPIPPIERAPYERSVAAVRAQLSEKGFAKAWAEGRAMSPEQALAAQGKAEMPLSAPQGQLQLPQQRHPPPILLD